MFNLALVNQIDSDYSSSDIIQDVSATDTMQNEFYDDIGLSASLIIKSAVLSSYVHSVDRVLDVPCGHGRVLRHLTAMFPHATIDACDLDSDGVAFCASKLGANPIVPSTEELSDVMFPAKYDIIWVGSLFTHTSEATTRRWMKHLASFLSEQGIVVATIHGRWYPSVHDAVPCISAEKWETILKDYEEFGYGYADYDPAENHDYIEGNYGISLCRPSKIMEIVESIPEIRVFKYTERAWADNQDVVVFGRPAYDATW